MFEQYQAQNVGAVGLVSLEDENRFRLSPEAWTATLNIRFSGNSALPGYAWQPICKVGSGAERAQYTYVVGFGGSWWLAFAESAIHSVLTPFNQPANTVFEVTRLDDAGDAIPHTSTDDSFWSITSFQGIPVATNGLDSPVAQFSAGVTSGVPTPGTRFVTLPGIPESARPLHIISHKGFLIAANFADDGNGSEFPTLIWWSDAAEPGNLPDNWDYADPASLSGRLAIPGDVGPITNVKLLHDAVYLFTAETAYRMSYVGGQFIWRLERVSGTIGAFGPFSVAELPHALVTVTQDDVRAFDGIRSTPIANDRVRNKVFDSITSASDKRNIVCEAYTSEQEVWLMVRSEEHADLHINQWSGMDPRSISWEDLSAIAWDDAIGHIWDEGTVPANNLAFVWNYADNTWSTRDVPFASSAAYMPEQVETNIFATAATWDQIRRYTSIDRWSAWTSVPWNAGSITSELADFHLYAVSARDNTLYRLDTGWDHNWIDNYSNRLERTAINLSDDPHTQFARAVYPEIDVAAYVASKSPGAWDDLSAVTWDSLSADAWDEYHPDHVPVTIEVGSHDTAHDDPSYRSGDIFDAGDYRVTTRCRGRRHALRLTSMREDWRFGSYTIEYDQVGRR